MVRKQIVQTAGAEMFAKFHKTSETCTAERHVWFTATTPPDNELKCICGKTTWAQAVNTPNKACSGRKPFGGSLLNKENC